MALLAGPSAAEKAAGMRTYIPPGTPLRSLTIADGLATVDLGELFIQGTNGESLDARLTQVVYTLTAGPDVTSVRLLVKGGTPLGIFPGINATGPLTRAGLATPSLPAPKPPTAPPAPPVSAATKALQAKLVALGYLPSGAADGEPGPQTTNAVIAFQKWQGLPRDGRAGPATLAALASASRPAPITKGGSGRRIEILLDRQVALAIEDDRVVRTIAISSGAPATPTPPGSYTVFGRYAKLVVRAVPGLAPVVAAVRRRDRAARVPERARHGRLARVRAADALRCALAVRLRAARHAGPRDRELAVRRLGALLAIALVLAAAPASSAAAPPPTITPGVLVVGIDMPSPGFQVGSVKGSQVLVARGFEIALARDIARRLGLPTVRFYQEGQFPRLFSAGPKPWDIALAQISITPARAATADFSVPYMAVDQGVLLSRLAPSQPRTLAALRSLQLCSLTGSTGADVVRGRVRPTRAALLYGNVTLLMQAVQTGRCAAAVYDAPSLATLKAQAPARYGTLAGVIPTAESYGVALPRGSALTAAVDAAVSALVADGTIDRLERTWLATSLASLPVLR